MTKKKPMKIRTSDPMVSFSFPTTTNMTSNIEPVVDERRIKEEEQKIIDRFAGGDVIPQIPTGHKASCHCGRIWKCDCDVRDRIHTLNYCKGCMTLG